MEWSAPIKPGHITLVDSRKQTGLAGPSSEPAADNALGDDELRGILEDIAMMNPAERQDGD
jgi:hypothetical protein